LPPIEDTGRFEQDVEDRAPVPTYLYRLTHFGAPEPHRRCHVKYMLILNTPRDGYTQYMKWPRKIIEANVAFMQTFSKKLRDAGALVGAEGLATPEQAKLVRAGRASATTCSGNTAGVRLGRRRDR
jgi:hypothetical protein